MDKRSNFLGKKLMNLIVSLNEKVSTSKLDWSRVELSKKNGQNCAIIDPSQNQNEKKTQQIATRNAKIGIYLSTETTKTIIAQFGYWVLNPKWWNFKFSEADLAWSNEVKDGGGGGKSIAEAPCGLGFKTLVWEKSKTAMNFDYLYFS